MALIFYLNYLTYSEISIVVYIARKENPKHLKCCLLIDIFYFNFCDLAYVRLVIFVNYFFAGFLNVFFSISFSNEKTISLLTASLKHRHTIFYFFLLSIKFVRCIYLFLFIKLFFIY
jgi:hypothetical protein